MSLPNLKSVLFGSALALASQTALANKPLPCPTTSPLVDNIGIVQGTTKQKVENRLRALDSEKHHQVVVVTVDNLAEYGYGSIEEMANAVGTGCKIGYRGENTGVVVLYTKTPSLYRIENASTERYITDADSKRAIRHSKSDGICKKEDVACRLDDITEGIDKLIRKEFPDPKSVQALEQSTQKFDEKKSAKETDELLNKLGLGAVIIVVFGGVVFGAVRGGNTIRRRALKKQIFELSIRFETEKIKYPKWFQDRYITKIERDIERLKSYSGAQLDNLVKGSSYQVREFDNSISTITNAIDGWAGRFEEITRNVKIRTDEVARQMIDVATLQKSLEEEGFKFDITQVSTVQEGLNPDETLSLIEGISSNLTQYTDRLRTIPELYNSIKGLDIQITQEFSLKQAEFTKTIQEHSTIFESSNQIALPKDMGSKVTQFVKDFQSAYQSKDMVKLEDFSRQAKSILSPIGNAIESLKKDIKGYQEVPEKVIKRQKLIQGIQVQSEYREEARKYAQKTGKRGFIDYDMQTGLVVLQQLLTSIIQDHSQKKNLPEIEGKITQFDTEYSKMKEYIGLGALLTAIIAEEIAEAARIERRRIEEEQRQKEEEESRNPSRRNSNDNESSKPTFNPGDGDGFDGGGATDD